MKAIRGNSGWSWDDEKGADITPEKKGTWDDYVAKHPAAQPFRNSGWVHLDAFDCLAPSSAKGNHVFRASQAHSAAEADEETQSTTANIEPDDVNLNGSPSQERSASESLSIDWVSPLL